MVAGTTTSGSAVDGAKPVLYLIACGGEATRGLPSLIGLLHQQGWEVCVFATPSGMHFLDVATVERLTGHTVRYEYNFPRRPDVVPPPDAMLVAPATFNTVSKLALGISDTLALGLLNKAIGLSMRVVICPTPGPGLSHHPVYAAHLDALRAWGVGIIHNVDGCALPLLDLGAEDGPVPWESVSLEIAKLLPAMRT